MKIFKQTSTRARWAALGAALAVTLGATGVMNLVSAAEPANNSTFVPTTPVRIVDTRSPALGLPGPLLTQVSQQLQVTGPIATQGGVGTLVPANATAVSLNVTAVQPTADGFISIRPGDLSAIAPTTSNLNFKAGTNTPNAVTVLLGNLPPNSGKIDIYYRGAAAGSQTDILVDIVGYYVPVPLEPTLYWAKIGITASGPEFIKTWGASGLAKLTDGEYEVGFEYDVSECGWIATLNDATAGISPHGEISVELNSIDDSTTLRVRTYSSAGAHTDLSVGDAFTLQVICNPT